MSHPQVMSETFEPKQELIDQFVGAAHGDLPTVKALLAHNPALLNRRASWGELALGAAAQTGSRAIAEHLLDAGAPQDICTAAMLGRSDTVAAMLPDEPGGANAAGAHGIPLLYHAVIGGHAEIAELLLAHGANVNAGAGGSPPLHGAVAFGRAALVEWLLHHGADPNILNHENQTPVAAALARNQPDLAALLRAHGGT